MVPTPVGRFRDPGAQGFKPFPSLFSSMSSKPLAVFNIDLHKGEDGYYVAVCREIPGCVSQGKTLKEATDNAVEALFGCLQTLAETLPRPKARHGRSVVRSRQVALTAIPA